MIIWKYTVKSLAIKLHVIFQSEFIILVIKTLKAIDITTLEFNMYFCSTMFDWL